MADNYSQFSEIFEFKTQEAAELFCALQQICSLLYLDDLSLAELGGADFDELDSEWQEYVTLWQGLTLDQQTALLKDFDHGTFDCEPEEKEPTKVWVYADEYGNIDGLARAAQVALQATGDTDSVFTLTWSATCSKPRVGEFGGGWIVINHEGCEFGNAWDAAAKAAKEIKAK